jgi:hypothetical protein
MATFMWRYMREQAGFRHALQIVAQAGRRDLELVLKRSKTPAASFQR